METLHRRCAGLDVHQKEIVACRRLVSGQKARSELARFPTTTRGLVDLSTWLSEAKVTHVAMEATGVYWKPVWQVLCHDFNLILANASHIRNVPGARATPMTRPGSPISRPWADPSFVRAPATDPGCAGLDPHAARVDARDRSSHPTHSATLEEANIKVTSVISDILGLSGRRI